MKYQILIFLRKRTYFGPSLWGCCRAADQREGRTFFRPYSHIGDIAKQRWPVAKWPDGVQQVQLIRSLLQVAWGGVVKRHLSAKAEQIAR